MKAAARSARQVLFGDRPVQLTGRGTRVLLFDSGIGGGLDMGGRLINLAAEQDEPAASVGGDSHGYRGASICLEGQEAADREGGALGIAPEATGLCAIYMPVFPRGYGSFIRSVLQKHGRLDVMAHPYSYPEDYQLATEGRADFTLLGDADPELSSTIIAAAGHDGAKGVRFPALCESVLAVGVCDEQRHPTRYCGVSPEVRKPELLVPEGDYLARLEDRELGTLNGTSAAVNIVAGLAALWCEKLRQRQQEPVPALVRAALLASSEPSASPAHRVVAAPEALVGEAPFFARYEGCEHERRWTHALHVSPAGPLRICAVARRGAQGHLWLPRSTTVRLRVRAGDESFEAVGDGWALLELSVAPRQTLAIEVEAEGGGVEGMAVFALGAEAAPVPAARSAPLIKKSSRVIVGISASHDASACVIRDGKLEHAIQLERVTRKKHDGQGFLHSREAVDYCLAAAGLRPKDVDVFAFNLQPVLPGYVGLSQPTADAAFELFSPFEGRALFVSHHLAHAFGAFFASPFEEAAAFVCDGSGGSTVGEDDLLLWGPEFEAYLSRPLPERPALHVQSTYTLDSKGYRLVDREYSPSFNVRCGSASLGETYAAVSQYVFGDWQEGAKLMGLAPYGSAEECGPSFLMRNEQGRLQYRTDWKERFRQVLGERRPMQWRHLAARVQQDLSDALVERMKRVVEQTGQRAVAYTGGVALNSVANERLLRETGLEHLYILPASNDAGISIGAAAAAEFLVTGGTRRKRVESDFLGYPYGDRDCEKALQAYASVIEWEKVELGDVVARLEAGQVLGWFRGGAEFGPRALGNRSILADARRQEMWRHINRYIKFREDFRPFAPAVPRERAGEFFDLTDDSPYMLRVVPVRPEYRQKLGAVTHVDGSARVQTVDREVHPTFHELLTRYGERTGIPVLINTSLNVRGEPIVETPLQAIELLLSTHLDALVLGPYLVQTRRLRSGKVELSTRLRLAPNVEVTCESTGGKPQARLVARARGNREYELGVWLFDVLARCDGQATIQELLNRYLPGDVELHEALEALEAFTSLRLLLPVEPAGEAPRARAPEGSAQAGAPQAGGHRGLEGFVSEADRRPCRPENGRTRSVEETLSLILPLRTKLGITRVADITGYDELGIPVVAATRPSVSDEQITTTQGKGLRYEDALASALLEGVERFCASVRRPELLASPAELEARSEECCAPEQLGARALRKDERIEWLAATSLRSGSRLWMPAAEVLFPYHPPQGAVRPMRPSTTGLASGNTRVEAIVHAIHEVVERDAVSRWRLGAPGKLVDLESVDGPEGELLQRFVAAGIRVYVADLSELAPLPVYFAASWSPDGVLRSIVVAGQGASLSPRVAFRRALLEVAQSRVVAIQGSREDLIRHASDWEQTQEQAKARWEQGRELPRANGVVRLPPAAQENGSTAEALAQLLSRLEGAGYPEVLVTDLSDPGIPAPVVHVAIPGLVDRISDPERRRRVA